MLVRGSNKGLQSFEASHGDATNPSPSRLFDALHHRTNASGYGLGAVLSQKGRSIAFVSQALDQRAQARSVYERELMAIVFAMQKWRHYFLGQKFTVLTDQQALQHLLEQREIQLEYQKWLTKLLGYDFEIKYHLGLLNKAADVRVTPTSELMTLTVPSLIDIEKVKTEVEQDVELQKNCQELQEDVETLEVLPRTWNAALQRAVGFVK